MFNKDWNPDLYLRFDKERIQPSIDLVTRIYFPHPKASSYQHQQFLIKAVKGILEHVKMALT